MLAQLPAWLQVRMALSVFSSALFVGTVGSGRGVGWGGDPQPPRHSLAFNRHVELRCGCMFRRMRCKNRGLGRSVQRAARSQAPLLRPAA